MKALEKALAYFNFSMPLDSSAFQVLDLLRDSPLAVSRNAKRTKGRKFASQKSRANRRKAARR